MKTQLLAILIILVMSGAGFAHTDPTPKVTITADRTETGTSVALTITAEDSGFMDGIVSITLKEDGKAISSKSCGEVPRCTYTLTMEHLAKGSHNYAAYVKDRGGNVKAESVFIKFKGATPPPIFVFEDKPYAEEGKRLELNVLAEDFGSNAIKNISVTGLPKGAVFLNNVLSWTPNYNQSGQYTLWFSAADSKGQTTRKSMTITVANVNRLPAVPATDPVQGNFFMSEGSSTTFRLNVSDPDTKRPSMEWMLDGKFMSSNSAYIYKPDYDDSGSHVLVARVVDGSSLQRFMWNITVNNVNRAPKFAKIADKTVDEGDAVKVNVKATDPDDDALTYEAVEMPDGARFDPDKRLFEWRAETPGDYTASFVAKDPYGYAASAYFDIHVQMENLTLREKYDRLLHEWEEDNKNDEDRAKVTTGNSRKQDEAAYNSGLVCNGDYLCYTLTYLVQQF